ncbi:MAG: hypothetical protein AAF431_01320 [Pseudomonadota bacterium]
MISSLFFGCLALASVYVFLTDRNALLCLLSIGFTQDMVRKVTPGEPIIFIVTVGVLFGAILLGIWMKRGLAYTQEPFFRWTQDIRVPLLMFLAVLFLQLLHSFLRYNNIIVGLIGLTTYLAPFVAVIVGYHLGNSVTGIRAFMKLYIVFGMIVAFSVVLAFIGMEWTILKEVGLGIKIYDQGTVLKSYAGIMRSGEVAAWHISTSACLLLTLLFTSNKPRGVWLVAFIVVLLIIAVALTGRRKMLMMVTLFVSFYFIGLLYYRKTLDPKYFLGIVYVAITVWFGFEIISFDDYSDSLRNYIARGSTVFSEASGRFVELGINPIQWAYDRVGIIGGGLGIASQGSYLFNLSDVAGGSGEGGLGKIMVELGLPGLLAIGWLVLAITNYINSGLKLCARTPVNRALLPLMVSLSVLLAVNAATFSVATQVYGDIFILILLGLFGGFIFALPKLVMSSLQQQSRQQSASSAKLIIPADVTGQSRYS